MAAIVRKTYDTDSIVIRRVFANDPDTNQQISTNYLFATSSNGKARFQDGSAYLSTIGAPTSASYQSTVAGLGSAGYLSSGTAGDVTQAQLISSIVGLASFAYISSSQLISTVAGLGNLYLSTGGGSGDITRENLTSTTLGLGTLGYLSSSQLISTVAGLGNIYLSTGGGSGDITRENLTSTTLGLGTLGYLSSASLTSTVIGLSNVAVTRLVAGTGISLDANVGEITITNIGSGGGGITTTDLVSTVSGLGQAGYISSTQLTSSIQSSLIGLSNIAVTRLLAGTGISLDFNVGQVTVTNTGGGGGGIATADLVSTVAGLGQAGYISSTQLTSSLQSTLVGLGSLSYLSSLSLTSTVIGLSNVAVTRLVAGTGISLDANVGEITITNIGAGGGGITTTDLVSTVAGLGQANYISSTQLTSSIQSSLIGLSNIAVTRLLAGTGISLDFNVGQVTVTNTGGGGGGIATAELVSTVVGLGQAGYISSTQLTSSLQSTVVGLGTRGYLSSLINIVSTPLLDTTLRSTVAGLGQAGYISSTQLTSSLQSTVVGLGTSGYLSSLINIVSTPLLNTSLISTIAGLGQAGYISSTQLTSSLQSTVEGLGTIGYLSTVTGGGGVSQIDLTSTTIGLGSLGYFSSSGASRMFISANTTTTINNLFVGTRMIGEYNPIKLVVSTLNDTLNYVSSFPQDIGSYYFIDVGGSAGDPRIILPDLPNGDLNGWNASVKNSSNSRLNLTVSYFINGLSTDIPQTIGEQTRQYVTDGNNYYQF